MNVEDVIRASAADLAERVVPTAPDIDGLRRAGLRVKRRRAGIAAATAVAIVGGAFVTSSQLHRSEPEPVKEPRAELTGPVWWAGDGFRVGDHLLRLDVVDAVPVGFGTVRHGLVYGSTSVVFHPFDGAPVPLSHREPVWGPVGDSDGNHAAWIEKAADGHELVVHDTSGDLVARLDVGYDRNEAIWDPPVLLLTDDRVVYWSDRRLWEERFGDGGPPARLQATQEQLVDVADGVEVRAGPPIVDEGTGTAALRDMSFVGRAQGRAPTYGPVFDEGLLSDDGRWFATTMGYQDDLRLVVVDTATGRPSAIPADVRGAPAHRPYGWSYGDTLMVLSFDGTKPEAEAYELLACEVDEGRCTPVPDGSRSLSFPNAPPPM